jgi:DNA-binding NtrC family response regulator
MFNSTVLVIAADERIVALLSALVHAEGGHVVSAWADEHPVAAVGRLRPDIVLAEIDADARGDAVLGAICSQAAEIDAVLWLFSSSGSVDDLGAIARHHGVPFFALPIGVAAFHRLIAGAMTESSVRHHPLAHHPPTQSRDGNLG